MVWRGVVWCGVVWRSGAVYALASDAARALSGPDATNLTKFLNRLLGVPVKLQNQLFNYFTDTLAVLVQQAKRMGKWDGGILGEGRGRCARFGKGRGSFCLSSS